MTFGVPSAVEQDVGRLQVAVDDAARRGRACIAPASVSHQRPPPRAAAAACRASLPVEAAAGAELQREERPAVVLADLVDLHDVRVLQPGDRLRLGRGSGPARPPPAWPPARIIFSATTRFSAALPGLVDDAHAAAAQLAQDLVARRGVARPYFRLLGRPLGLRRRQGGVGFVGGLGTGPVFAATGMAVGGTSAESSGGRGTGAVGARRCRRTGRPPDAAIRPAVPGSRSRPPRRWGFPPARSVPASAPADDSGDPRAS